jgi:uncharacterized protein (DUF1697 family)
MTRYIALLRGINVGGHQVKMADLRRHFEALGLGNVASYIQTGNVFFDSDRTDVGTLRAEIEAHLQQTLGWATPVCLRTVAALETLLQTDPFAGTELTPDKRFAVTFLAEPKPGAFEVGYRTPDGAYELVGVTPSELFVVWHLQNGRPGNSYGKMEKELGVPTTTRFWHTTAKILAAARK